MDLQGEGTLSSDGNAYQYAAWLDLGAGKRGVCTVIGLIPARLDFAKLDPSIQVCKELALRGGYSKLVLVHLFALCGSALAQASALLDPIGPDNDRWIKEVASHSEMIIAAWGDFPRIGERAQAVLSLLKTYDIYSVQNNRNGTPTNPLAWRLKSPKIYRRAVADSLPIAG